MTTEISFDQGTLVLKGDPSPEITSLPGMKWDSRTRVWRAPACFYREIILALHNRKLPYEDLARNYRREAFPLVKKIVPRPFQQEAMEAWYRHNMRGVVCLPTGAGKTILAVMLIEKVGRPTLIHVPTIDLMQQWHAVLTTYFGREIGLLGGGYKEIAPITVATYDSALLHVADKGNRFAFAIFDECHHLPGEQYRYTAISSLAPFRLGLTATPERSDGLEEQLYQLAGELCYRAEIRSLEGETLAPYEVVTLPVALTEEERLLYEGEREIYLTFLRSERINMGARNGWQQFIWKSSRTPEGRRAFKAYLTQKKLSLAASAKETAVWELLVKHAGDRILIFTQDNETAYRLGRRYLLPVLTHHTRVKEREQFLSAFREGRYPVLVTSKVLNEGVDVPEANVGIIVSGSGSVREHVQRLGRLLRARPGKKAVLYELIAADTGEHFVNQRRRKHDAYQKPGSA
ncbi:MAG TPA: DEAD/DEAH box helicase family protein [Calditrichia bacterium]|nr:DEAD/DEAH box helicase family protein [Calditrichota bacterium]HQU70687.1 DEAD/DEAH box helicase family protein [Calditrichia bacterium]HQV30224.1 DEAD/DEAH box helicase family protein [Calditrichia bacterium]